MGGMWLVEEDVGGRQETSNLLMVTLWCQLPNMECGAILRWYHMEGSGCRVGREEEKERNNAI